MTAPTSKKPADEPKLPRCCRCKGDYTKGNAANRLCVGCMAQIADIHRVEGIIKWHRKDDGRPRIELRYNALDVLASVKQWRAKLDKNVEP